jgi:hypothetical protein
MKTTLVVYSLGVALTASAAEQPRFSADELNRRNIERRAVESVIWGMPAVNFERLLEAGKTNVTRS